MSRPEFHDDPPSTDDNSHDDGGNLGVSYNTPLGPPDHN